jgi:predicted amidohydrolase
MGYQAARESFAGAVSAPAGRLKVAAIQYPIEGGRSLEATLAKMEAYVRQARAGGAGLVVFPELFVLDRVSATGASRAGQTAGLTEKQQLARIAREETPTFFERAKHLARELDVAILAGSFPRELAASEGGGIVNTSLLAFPDGRIVMQDKLHLTPDEVTWGWKAGETLQVFEAPWGRSTILICYDSQFPGLSASLAQSAPEMILIPSMTGAKGLQRVRWSAQARAVEQHAFVVVTGTVEAAGSTQLDHSARAVFLSPQDAGFPGVLRQGPLNREAIVYSDLNLTQLRASRAKAGLYAGRDQVQRPVPVRVVQSE